MHLDKTKLHQLAEKTKKLDVMSQNNYGAASKTSVAQQLSKLLSGLSKWLVEHPNLSNGSSYGRKLADIKNRLPDKSRNQFGNSWLSDNDAKELQAGLLSLLQIIDRENKSIFIVHGRDHDMRDNVQNALRGMGLPTVVLDKEDDEGQTVIEKFIKEAERCEYAVILCSADDEGRLRIKGRAKEAALHLRARQNVVLEMGYFMALRGRENVFVLHPTESIEAPSDFAGMVYQTYDKAGVWKAKLVRELKKAGFKIPTKYSDRL